MRWRSPRLPFRLLFLSTWLGGAVVSGFQICAYNVENFNSEKITDYTVLHTLTRVLARCDITLLQEVNDPDGSSIKTLLASLNREPHRYEGYNYNSLSSQSLGPTDKKEQYVFIYRKERVNEMGQYQHPSNQHFTRPPFAVQFQSKHTAIKTFVLVPLRAEPSQAVQEMDRLYDVFLEVLKKWKNTNVMFLGDFHASCAYMTRRDRKNIRLFSNTTFSWLIGDKVDTTVSEEMSCAYDRIVVFGETFLKGIKPFSAGIFNFGLDFKITRSKVLEVSDHYPVRVELKSSSPLLQASPLLGLLAAALALRLSL